MAGVQICLILSFIFFYVLTRNVWVRIVKKENLRIELHLPLLSLHFTNTKNGKKKGSSISKAAYLRIARDAISRIKRSEIYITRIALPYQASDFDGLSTLRPFGLQGIAYTAIAYLRARTKSLVLSNNAIISSPDITELQFHITIKLYLYQLIYAIVTLRLSVNKEKKRGKKKHVGE